MCIKKKLSKSIFTREPSSLLLGKNRERNNLVYNKFYNIRIDTAFDSESKKKTKKKQHQKEKKHELLFRHIFETQIHIQTQIRKTFILVLANNDFL